MAVAVAQPRAVEDDRVIEQRPVAVGCRSQFLQIRSEQRHVMLLNDGTLGELHRIVLVVRQLMMGFGDAHLRVRSRALFTAVHESDHPCQVALVRQQLQVVQQLHVRVERIGNARGPINGTAPNSVTNQAFANALGRALHRPSFLRTPQFALRTRGSPRPTA